MVFFTIPEWRRVGEYRGHLYQAQRAPEVGCVAWQSEAYCIPHKAFRLGMRCFKHFGGLPKMNDEHWEIL